MTWMVRSPCFDLALGYLCIIRYVFPGLGRWWEGWNACWCLRLCETQASAFLSCRTEARDPRLAPDCTAHQPGQPRGDGGSGPAPGEGAGTGAPAGPKAAHLPQVPSQGPTQATLGLQWWFSSLPVVLNGWIVSTTYLLPPPWYPNVIECTIQVS